MVGRSTPSGAELAGDTDGGGTGDSSALVADYNPIQTDTLEMAIDTATFDLDLGAFYEQYGESDVTVRIYSSLAYKESERALVGEQSKTHEESKQHWSVPLDLDHGYGQQYHFTVEIDNEQKSRPERECHREGFWIPYDNKARGEERLKRVYEASVSGEHAFRDEATSQLHPQPTEDVWGDLYEPKNKTWYYFDTPDEDPFGNPPIPRDEYPEDVYKYHNLTVTIITQTAVFDKIGEQRPIPENKSGKVGFYDKPRYMWFAFSFDISEWEMLEANRWNSDKIARYETEFDSGAFDSREEGVEYIRNYGGGDKIPVAPLLDADFGGGGHGLASKALSPYKVYKRHLERWDERMDQHAIKFNAGRPLAKRLADTIESGLDNHPGFAVLEYEEYYKATVLKNAIGSGESTYALGNHAKSTEQFFYVLKQRIVDGDEYIGVNCVDATGMFAGVAAHLVESPVVCISSDKYRHTWNGLHNLNVPENLPPMRWRQAYSEGKKIQDYTLPRSGGVDMPLSLASVEPVFGESTIGYRTMPHRGAGDVHAAALEPVSVNSCLRLNDEFEPDINGEARGPDGDAEDLFAAVES